MSATLLHLVKILQLLPGSKSSRTVDRDLKTILHYEEKHGEIDTVSVGVENVGEEDCIKIKTEEDYIQLVLTIKTKQEKLT